MIDVDLLKFARIKGIGVANLKLIYELNNNDPKQSLDYIIKNKKKYPIHIPSDDEIKKEIDDTLSYGGFFLSINNDNYPHLLKETATSPIVLTGLGNKNLVKNNNKIVGIVGSRNPTLVSKQIAKDITKNLADSNFIITSGMAYGIDKIAHIYSLKRGTIAFLAHGISFCYPKENINLMNQIVSNNGLVLTEFKFSENPSTQNFPKRNRLIAGAAIATIVVEGKLKSGTMITARYAFQFNRNVYAVAGSPVDDNFSGNNYLIANNIAKIITSIDNIGNDIVSDFGLNADQDLQNQQKLQFQDKAKDIDIATSLSYCNIQMIKKKIIDYIEANKISIDFDDLSTLYYLADVFDVPLYHLKLALVETLL